MYVSRGTRGPGNENHWENIQRVGPCTVKVEVDRLISSDNQTVYVASAKVTSLQSVPLPHFSLGPVDSDDSSSSPGPDYPTGYGPDGPILLPLPPANRERAPHPHDASSLASRSGIGRGRGYPSCINLGSVDLGLGLEATSEREIKCPVCPRKGPRAVILRHLKIHDGPFVCKYPGCGTRFKGQLWLTMHEIKVHGRTLQRPQGKASMAERARRFAAKKAERERKEMESWSTSSGSESDSFKTASPGDEIMVDGAEAGPSSASGGFMRTALESTFDAAAIENSKKLWMKTETDFSEQKEPFIFQGTETDFSEETKEPFIFQGTETDFVLSGKSAENFGCGWTKLVSLPKEGARFDFEAVQVQDFQD